MQWLIELQRWLYGGMAAGMRSAEDVTLLPALLGSAVLFGALHALMPWHGGGRAPAFEKASAILIFGTGIFLLWRSLRPHQHEYAGDGRMLAFVTGLVPCPLTTFILTYALAKNQLAVGFAAAGASQVMNVMARTEGLRLRVGQAAELAGACAIIILGLLMLAR